MPPPDLDRFLEEAEQQPFAGWDFSWLGDRRRVRPVRWDFRALVSEQAGNSPDLLDMGTGGAEWLSRLPSPTSSCPASSLSRQHVSG